MKHRIVHPIAKEFEIIEKNRSIENEVHTPIDYKKKVCVKPWGHEFLAYESKKIGIWILTMKYGHSTSLHTHFKKDTILVVLSGCAKIGLINNSYLVLNAMESIYIPRYKFHSIASFSPETTILEMEVFTEGVSFTDKNDLLRLDDKYNRKAVGYESSVQVETENLDQYSAFYLEQGQYKYKNTVIEHHIVSNATDIQKLRNKTYSILLEGHLFTDLQYCKEGTILQKEKEYIPIGTAHILTIDKVLWEEDTKIIYNQEQLGLVVNELRSAGKNIVLTSGCFDILHIGHLETLKRAKMLGDKLIVCLSSDEQIKELKGSTRPINNYQDRINLFKTIHYVDYIVLYNEEHIEEERTLGNIMKLVDPDVWVKGSDYSIENISKKHPYLRNICILSLIDEKSTTNIINKILQS